MLTGAELIDFVKTSESANDMELARAAGYVRTTKTGKDQVLKKAFMNALLAAKGIERPMGRGPGKTARYETSVHKNGVILIGKTYSEVFGLNPGDFLDIVIEGDCIKLVPQPFAEEAEEASTKSKVKA
jgi:hypothetical protein